MSTARQYLVEKGIVQAGSRGRLSLEAQLNLKLAILEGVRFDDYNLVDGKVTKMDVPAPVKLKAVKTKSSVMQAPVAMGRKPVRDKTQMRIVDKQGISTTLDYHPDCGQSIQFCRCTSLNAPSWIIDVEKFELI